MEDECLRNSTIMKVYILVRFIDLRLFTQSLSPFFHHLAPLPPSILSSPYASLPPSILPSPYPFPYLYSFHHLISFPPSILPSPYPFLPSSLLFSITLSFSHSSLHQLVTPPPHASCHLLTLHNPVATPN